MIVDKEKTAARSMLVILREVICVCLVIIGAHYNELSLKAANLLFI